MNRIKRIATVAATALIAATAAFGEPANRGSERGFTLFVRDVAIGTAYEIVSSDTGFTQMPSDAVITAAYAQDSKFDSLLSGNKGVGNLTAVWSGASTADNSPNNLFFKHYAGNGTVASNVSAVFSGGFSARSAGFLKRIHTSLFDVAGSWTIAGYAAGFGATNPSVGTAQVVFSTYASPDIIQVAYDKNGYLYGRVSDDGSATWDSVTVATDVYDSTYHFWALQSISGTGADKLRLTVDNASTSISFSNAATSLTLDTAMVFSFRSGSDCKCRADELMYVEDSTAVGAEMRLFAVAAKNEALGTAADSFRVHISGIGTDSTHIDTSMKVSTRTPVSTARTWHAFETAWIDTEEVLPVIVFSGATSPRSAKLDSIPAGKLDYDVAQVLLGKNDGLSVLESVEFVHEGAIDTTDWELRIYPDIEDTRDVTDGYFVRTARTHTNAPRAKIDLNYVMKDPSFVQVWAKGTASTKGSVILTGRRK